MTNKEVIFNSLSFGNLILAKRLPDTRFIEKGHRNAPFLVLGRKNDFLICLYATSKETQDSLIKLSKNNYNLKKDTYITSDMRLISIDEFLTSIYYLNDKEKKDLNKSLYINGLDGYAFLNEVEIEVGDIIQLEQNYLIVGENANSYLTIQALCDDENKTYNFNYNFIKPISKNKEYKRIAFLADEELNECIEKIKFNQKNKNKIKDNLGKDAQNPLNVGNLVIYKNFFYYLYYELNGTLFSFAVSKNKTLRSQKITIDGEEYHANFGLKQDFDKKQKNVCFVASATEEEKQLIKEKRRNNK